MVVLAGLVTGVASPFSRIIQFTQPSGEVISLHGRGDEFYAVFATLEGYTVVFDEALGGYCYARLSADGRRLESTGLAVSKAPGAGRADAQGDPAALGGRLGNRAETGPVGCRHGAIHALGGGQGGSRAG